MKILENYSIKDFSTMKIGGVCRAIYFPETVDDIIKVLSTESSPLVIGQFSNILLTDKRFERAIILLRENFSNIKLEDNFIYADAGATMNQLSSFALDHSIKGFEFMEGIPGSIGGGIFMNAGAYGGEFKDIIESVFVLRDFKVLEIDSKDCEFGPRHSIFQDNKDLIVGAKFSIEVGSRDQIKEIVDDLHDRRINKQPLDFPSCGSVFKRPEGYYASKLIDDLNLKGLRVGGAMVSEKHAGFIVNYDNAKFDDVVRLIQLIQNRVKEAVGVNLETELRIIEE